MLSLYEKYDSIAGVVGWLDLASPEFGKQYARFRKHKGFVGFQPMLQDLPDQWLLQTQVKSQQLIIQLMGNES
ncbi:hypothetical protein [Paenibacillus sp. UNC451MF]|uniref:hypothetical protein n=1 Tax=Paenibacillus sp. UNC451MF TaxID=1449063 RepID=UPI000B2E9801|nr:hypothetical protein [Paenibacillus sp. UNC451MF]